MIFSKKQMFWIIPVSSLIICNAAAAQDNQTTETSDGSKSTLKGSVHGVVLLTGEGLIKIGESARTTQSASMQLVNEMNRKNMAISRQPNVIGPGIVIPAAPNVTGTIPMGDLPPRNKFVAQFYNQLAYHVKLIRNEVAALILPENPSDDLKTYWSQIQAQSEDMHNHLDRLQTMISNPPYNKDKVSKEALGIYDESISINKLRKKIQKILKS